MDGISDAALGRAGRFRQGLKRRDEREAQDGGYEQRTRCHARKLQMYSTKTVETLTNGRRSEA
jgi:hypothetical protein